MKRKRPENRDHEAANKLTLDEFKAKCIDDKSSPLVLSIDHDKNEKMTPKSYEISIETAESISSADLEACYNLIWETSGEMYATFRILLGVILPFASQKMLTCLNNRYKKSTIGWSPTHKRAEMREPDMRYLLINDPAQPAPTALEDNGVRSDLPEGLLEKNSDALSTETPVSLPSILQGFVSFQITTEDSRPCVYLYEIHLQKALRGKGVGQKLMGIFEGVGKNVGVKLAMLTVFTQNEGALRLYERLGYTEWEGSPKAKKLRGGKIKQPTYVILEKVLD
jgi:N-alpha-acetyltransferase 40